MILSVLIPTLDSRREQFDCLYERLAAQVHAASAEVAVEVLYYRDDGELSVGAKRNALIRRACGRFIAFIDDDDDISDDYISRICEVISRRPDIDCIGIKGIVTFSGGHPREFSHSIQYQDYFSRGHNYFRPPYHLNPILREIALRFPFLPISYSEDAEWALRLQRAGVLRREEFIETPLYLYKSRRWWSYQLMLDWSEPMRHALGLRMVNRVLARKGPPSNDLGHGTR
jgi:glycosyltransferase involved in cell wall biosynthesis